MPEIWLQQGWTAVFVTHNVAEAIFLQTVPIVAIAPLIITWFGYGFQSVVIVAY